MSSGTSTASASLPHESQTDTCQPRPSSLMCVSSFSPVRPDSTEALRTWLQQAFPANHSVSPANKQEPMTGGTCGPQQGTAFATYSLDPFCLRTSPDLFPAAISEPSSLTWPRWGMWGDGALSELPTVVRRISVTGSGLLPTPLANDAVKRGNIANDRRNGLAAAARYWPTPSATEGKGAPTGNALEARRSMTRGVRLCEEVARGGETTQQMTLNPAWVEWLMGWPIGWTDLQPLETVRFQQWLHAHGRSWPHEPAHAKSQP